MSKPTAELIAEFGGESEALAALERTAPNAEAREINAVSLGDFLAMEIKPREFILSPWLPTQGLALVYAKRGAGKTHVALGVAYAVITGGSFLGWQATTARNVLYIDGEMPACVMQERLAAIVAANDTEPQAELTLITPDLQEWGTPDLSTPEGQFEIEPYLSDVELIIIDNLSTLCRSYEENKADSWLSVQEWALRMRAQGRSVLFIHHAGKGGQQRGTSRKEDVLDSVLMLRQPKDYSPEQGAAFECHFEKSRGAYGDSVQPFEARLTADASGRQTWVTATIEDSNVIRVADLLREGYSQQDIAAELELSKGYVSKLARKAREEAL